MVHGLPDWGLRGPKSTTYGLDDLGEAVARLGSPVVWDRRGDVVVLEGFEGGGGTWYSLTAGAGASTHRTCGGAHTGAYGVELMAGSNGLRYGCVYLVSPALVLGPCGFEAWFGVAEETSSIRLAMTYYTGTRRYSASLDYIHADGGLWLATQDVPFVRIGEVTPLYERYGPRHVAKLVADFSMGTYERVILDDVTYSVHGIPFHDAGDPLNAQFTAALYHYGNAGENPAIVADDLILTQNEPVSI